MEPKIDWDLFVQTEILKRDLWAANFLQHIFGITEYMLSDHSSLSDFQDLHDIKDISRRVFKKYWGFSLQKHHFSIPLWRFLDELERHRINAKSKSGAPETEVSMRDLAFDYFLDNVLKVDAIYFSDLSTLGDFVYFQDTEHMQMINEQIWRVYGTQPKLHHFEMPLWKLIDELEENCLGSELEE